MTEPGEAQKSPALTDQPARTSSKGVLTELRPLARALNVSPVRRSIILLASGIAFILCATVVGQIRLNVWQGDFYDAIEQKNLPGFGHQILVFLIIVSVLLILAVSQTWLHELLKIRLREWLTRDLLDEWLVRGREHRMQFEGEIGINPDQRVHEDTRHLTELTASLGVGFLQATLLLVSFLGVLWVLSENVVFTVGGTSFTIPGYMVWCALAFALGGSWITWRVGRPLIELHSTRYGQEAELRFALVRGSESAEGIALYRGEANERRLIGIIFGRLLGTMRDLANALAQLTWITSGYGWLALVVPIVVAAPGYFGGNLSFGNLMMVVGAFFQVQQSLRWFVDNFVGIADWRATLARIANFREALLKLDELHAEAPHIEIDYASAGNLVLEGVGILLPDGKAELDETHIEIRPGEHVLIVGAQGAGKTALVLALAGLWPWGTGRIHMPPRDTIVFMREQPYLPLGTLRSAVTYPEPDHFEDAAVRSVLHEVGLDRLSSSLDRDARWERTLSLEEQQRLAFARLLLHMPQWVFLDDALSALDKGQRQSMMSVFEGAMRGAAVISTSRIPEQGQFYTRIYTLRRVPSEKRLPLRARPKRGSTGAGADG